MYDNLIPEVMNMTGNELIRACPSCGRGMHISRLSCANCGIEIAGNFDLRGLETLTDEEMTFIKLFLSVEGNFSSMQRVTDISYSQIKTKLGEINRKLGNSDEEDINMNELLMNNDDDLVVSTLKRKIAACGGKASMPALRGDPIAIRLSPSGDGIESAGLKNFVFKWGEFSAIVKKANELGGMMYRGDSAAHSGERIGSEKLSLDTIDGFISTHFFGAKVGDTTLRRSTYYAGILSWAGIVTNHRSEGKGGYITVNEPFKDC